jgi:hypothetical protein
MLGLTLRPSKAPNIPLATNEYDRGYVDQLTSALRLYFNQIDNDWAAVLGTNGGAYFQFPHIAASDSTDQYATALNTPTVIRWNTLDSGSGFTLNAPGSATCELSGVYKITYSAQLANTANAVHDATFWLRVNGVDVPNSATTFTLPARKSASVPSFVCGYSEVVFQVNGDDVVELWWATDLAATSGGGLGVFISHDNAQTVPYARPAIPSMIGSRTFVSRLPTEVTP